MIKFKDDSGKPLPKKVQKKVNDFIDNIPKINWFKPSPDLKKEEVDKQIKFTLECFGIKAKIEYRKLKTVKDWDAARDAAWGAAWDAARGAARGAAWDAAWDAARDAARDAAELLVLEKIKDKYPDGAFIQLFKLWEMGLYPIGVLEKKFIVYVPEGDSELYNNLR